MGNFILCQKVNDALKIKNTDIAKELSLPPVKLHCSMLAEDGNTVSHFCNFSIFVIIMSFTAIKAALKDYHVKQSSRNRNEEMKNAVAV